MIRFAIVARLMNQGRGNLEIDGPLCVGPASERRHFDHLAACPQRRGRLLRHNGNRSTDGNNTKRAQLVLPSSVSPFEAVYMGDTFVFSIEAAYSGVGSLGNMGTYIGNEGGPYLSCHASRSHVRLARRINTLLRYRRRIF